MQRKLVKQGTSTMMISLPSKWIKSNNLRKGSEINLKEEGNELHISTEKDEKEIQRKVIDVSGYQPLVNRVLMSLYIQGVDEIEIKFDKRETVRDFQQRVINELIGFEIIKQTSNSLLVKDITGADNQNIDDLIKRVFFILDSMAEELISSLTQETDFEQVIEIDTSVNKFINFCLRMINKKGYKELKKTEEIYGIFFQLEQIGDIYKSIAKEYANKKINKEAIEILKDLRASLADFKELFFNYQKERAVHIAKIYEKTKQRIKTKGIIDFYLMQLNETIIRINNYLLVINL